MAAAGSAKAGEATHLLKYNTWVLKVPTHCLGCKREVKKLLQRIEGVYSTTIDSQEQKVTVSRNIDSEILLKKLLKTGKHAEQWNEKPAEKPRKMKNKVNQEVAKTKSKLLQIMNPRNKKPNNTKETNSNKKRNQSQSQSPGAAAETGNADNGGKAKKGKAQRGNNCGSVDNGGTAKSGLANAHDQGRSQGGNQVNLSPRFDQWSSALPNQGPATVHVMNYNAAHPSSRLGYGVIYQVPTSSP